MEWQLGLTDKAHILEAARHFGDNWHLIWDGQYFCPVVAGKIYFGEYASLSANAASLAAIRIIRE